MALTLLVVDEYESESESEDPYPLYCAAARTGNKKAIRKAVSIFGS